MTYTAKADGPEDRKPRRDPKKLFLVIGLGILSWVATYIGMLELIEGNMGELPVVHKIIIGFSVAMLMTMIIWLLDQLFAPNNFLLKTIYAAGYIFLTLISVGFGFGFYWKVLESRSEATRGAESAITQVQGSLHAASTRLEQLQTTLVQLTALSTQKAELERTQGTSCPMSKPGDGPRRKLRDDDAQRFTFASDFVKTRAGQVKSEMTMLDADLIKIVKDDKSIVDGKTGTRNDFLRSVGRKLDLTVTGFNAFRTDPQLKQIRADLAERAEKTSFADSRGGTFTCPDTQLQTALRGVVRAIDGLPELQKPQVAVVEGSEATIEAFRRLSATFVGAISLKMPPSAEDLRDLQKKAVQSVESTGTVARPASFEQAGLSRRDYIPLSIALFVDLCLLLVSISRPTSRMHSLIPKMREAEQGPVSEILTRFNDIHKDPQVRESFEIFRHVIFDFNGDYYAAIPLDAPKTKSAIVPVKDKTGAVAHAERRVVIRSEERQDLQLDAHQLANLFTSFEKERIFARVMMPVLTTRAIQKKLARQGSKFAEAEAFRIYKFKNGAWQEMILGAIMGAAKRVEQQNAALAEERAHELPMARSPIVEPVAPPANDQAPLSAPRHFSARSDFNIEAVMPLPRRMQMPPSMSQRATTTAFDESPFAHHWTAESTEPIFVPPTQASAEMQVPQTSEPIQTGPVEAPPATKPFPSNHVEPTPAAFPSTAGATHEHTMTTPDWAAARAELHDVASAPLTPAASAAEPTIEIEARRESVTYRMPLSEAPLPPRLHTASTIDVPSSSLAMPAADNVQALISSQDAAHGAAGTPRASALEVDQDRAPKHVQHAATQTEAIDFRRIAGKFGLNTRN
jgi:hypothetical protein